MVREEERMKRQVIQIDEQKCNGCGLCAQACHEGAIGMVNGKAKLLRDDYCDGMGDCLPSCPQGAISFIEKETVPYDKQAVQARKAASGCPGTRMRMLRPEEDGGQAPALHSQLRQWPVQIKLVPVTAPYFQGADLLVAADCTAYAYAAMHQDFIKGRVTLVGCPKLDAVDYTEKLQAILESNDIRSLVIVRMEVPCCGGLEAAAKTALKNSGKFIPWRVVTITIDGNKIE
jgi:ferredoxin